MPIDVERGVSNAGLRTDMRASTLRYIEEREREGKPVYPKDVLGVLKSEFPGVDVRQTNLVLRELIEDHKLEGYRTGGRVAYRRTAVSAEDVDMTIHRV